MHAYGIDILHHLAFAHKANPVWIDGAGAAQHGLLAAVLDPVGCASDHPAEAPPLRVEGHIPLTKIIGSAPQLYPLEAVSEQSDHLVYEVGIPFGIARRRGCFGRHAERWWSRDEIRQHFHLLGQAGKQPGIPLLASRRTPICPRNCCAQVSDAKRLQICQNPLDTLIFT